MSWPERSVSHVRIAGAFVAIAIALGILVIAAVLVSVGVIQQIPGARAAFEPGFFLVTDTITGVASWAPIPIAAAVGGWLFADWAAAGDRLSGVWMGSATYGVGVALGVLAHTLAVPLAYGSSIDPVELLISAPMLLALGLVVLAPLFLVCLGAGTLWALAVRTLVASPGPEAGTPRLSSLPIIVATVAICGLWLLAAAILGATTSLGPID